MTDQDFIKIAFNQAKKSVEQGGFPAGAILVKDNKIISRGSSIGNKNNDPTSHSETSCIKKVCKKLKTIDLNGAVLYASLQPCLMCFSVANWANISKIVYGCQKTDDMIKKQYYEGNTDIRNINKNNNHKIKLKYLPDFEADSLKLIKKWENLNKK